MMQPINPNNALDNEHCLYVAGSGGGKTTAVKKFGRIKGTDQVVFWDPHQDYDTIQQRKVRRYKTFKAFFAALRAARATKRGFKIALTVPESRKNFLKFCEVVKGFGDGLHAKRLHVVIEELPQVTESVGKEVGAYGWLLTVGRKFGFIVHSVAQRVVEISKTAVSQSVYKWVGVQFSRADAKRMSDETDVPLSDILNLNPLEYYFKSPNAGNFKKGRLTF
tara:strand:+ start:8982 stop:9644 length:663 start_codon:yes stop_codon:yes gene_type:complete